MRVVLVDNLLLEHCGGVNAYVLQPHLGLISLIAVLESANHQGILYDPKLELARLRLTLDSSLYRSIADDILALKPDVVGLTSLGCNFICTIKVAQYLRAREKELPIILGGPHASVLSREIMTAFPIVDVIVCREAELKILPLLDGLKSGKLNDVPGIVYRCGGSVIANDGDPYISDLDALPYPAYHQYPIADLGLSWLRVDAGRGCPFHCTFCSTASFFGRKYRLKSAQRLLAEMESLNERFGVRHFSLTHDLFTVSRRKVMEFCDAVTGRGFTWKCSARMDCVDDELLSIMSAAGCREIYYGVEAGTSRMQEITQKRLDLNLFSPMLDATERSGMAATVSFITGYPQETQADQDGTLDMLGSCFYRNRIPLNVQLHLLTPEPGTELMNECTDRLDYDGHISDFNFPTLEADDSDVMQENSSVFLNHHFYRSVLPREQHVFVTSLYQHLYHLGREVIAALLDRFDGRMGVLFRELWEWSRLHGCHDTPTGILMWRFVSSVMGNVDPLVSVIKYRLAGARLAGRISSEGEGLATFGTENEDNGAERCGATALVLSPKAAVFRSDHPAPALLESLLSHNTSWLSCIEQCNRTRWSFILLMSDSKCGTIRNFEIDEVSADLCEYMRIPRTTDQWMKHGSELGFSDWQSRDLISALQDQGILGNRSVPDRDMMASALCSQVTAVETFC